jgi:hypothetical protein
MRVCVCVYVIGSVRVVEGDAADGVEGNGRDGLKAWRAAGWRTARGSAHSGPQRGRGTGAAAPTPAPLRDPCHAPRRACVYACRASRVLFARNPALRACAAPQWLDLTNTRMGAEGCVMVAEGIKARTRHGTRLHMPVCMCV